MKKIIIQWMGFVTGTLFGVLATMVALSAFSQWVRAASYSLIFNNVEQGPGSTSSPTISVNGNQATKDTLGQTAAAPATPPIVTTLNPTPAPATTSTTEAKPAIDPVSNPHRFRTEWMATTLGESQVDRIHVGGSLGVKYFLLPEVGVGLITGIAQNRYLALEGELLPLKLDVMGNRRFLELGVLLGGMTMTHQPFLVHGGLGATLNFNDRLGVNASLRTNLNHRADERLLLANAGLTVRF